VVAFPNPDGLHVYAETLAVGSDEIGDVYDAARAAGVQPGTIRVWVCRGKIEPLVPRAARRGAEDDLFHLPTVAAAARAGRPFAPRDPAANSRGRHRRRVADLDHAAARAPETGRTPR
jgi:hypothetical protein